MLGVDVVCLSHLRWNFVYQRPQHLMSRFARASRVFFVEEPVVSAERQKLERVHREGRLEVFQPRLPERLSEQDAIEAQERMLQELVDRSGLREYVLWYYTPAALAFTRELAAVARVYDCMDELAAFRGAPASIGELEQELLERVDLVFTGGFSLYEAKRGLHPEVHLFPSSVDAAHFAAARTANAEPPDQAALPRPRLGFFGVVDERMDLELLQGVADARPDWQLVIIGPVAKIAPETLPRRANIHYLGMKQYAELPAYLAGWDVAVMPFARNEATRFISPTKTLEYLAAGKPVVATPIADVVRPYGEDGLVRIAGTVGEFAAAIEAAFGEDGAGRAALVERFLRRYSWERTAQEMAALVGRLVPERRTASAR